MKIKPVLLKFSDAVELEESLNAAYRLSLTPEIDRMASLEADLNVLMDEFKDAALYVVHFIVKNHVAALNLYNLYGDDGDKFMTGGLMIRRAKDWYFLGKHISLTDPKIVKGSTGANVDINQVV